MSMQCNVNLTGFLTKKNTTHRYRKCW